MNHDVIMRKPKLHFDTATKPKSVTFDDSLRMRCSFPWQRYVEARWDFAVPDVIRIEIGQWVIVLRGHNLRALFEAIEERTLARVCALPELSRNRACERDTFVTEIIFIPT